MISVLVPFLWFFAFICVLVKLWIELRITDKILNGKKTAEMKKRENEKKTAER